MLSSRTRYFHSIFITSVCVALSFLIDDKIEILKEYSASSDGPRDLLTVNDAGHIGLLTMACTDAPLGSTGLLACNYKNKSRPYRDI